MKRINRFIVCAIFAFMFLISNVKANPYKNTQTIDGVTTVPCTYFAWQQAYENAGVSLPGWGNAGTWYNSAIKAGYSVGSEPRPNSIAIWSRNKFGHVAYVVSVEGDTMTINEGGVYDFSYNEETGESTKVPYNGNGIIYGNIAPSSGVRNEDSVLLGFIYLDDAPKTPVKKTEKQTETPKKENAKVETKEEVKKEKSKNNNLRSLIIKGIDFEFKKDVLDYKLSVENEVDKIEITAEVEDKTAKVLLEPSYNLEVGDNEITINVEAEDGAKKDYKININRKEKIIEEKIEEQEEKQDDEKDEKENKISSKKIVIISSILVIILILAVVIIIFLKRKNNSKK